MAAVAAAVQPSVVSITVRAAGQAAEGSGVIVRSDGLILTSNHVVADAAQGGRITVAFSDGTTATAGIVGTGAAADLAVIRAEGVSRLQAATLGDSDALQVGDTVLAIGSPLGLKGSVTAGIVSALHRSFGVDEGGRSAVTISDALAPAVAALVGMGATTLWRLREHPAARYLLAGSVAVTGLWSFVLLRRTPDWHPWLAPLVLVAGLGVAMLLVGLPWRGRAAAAVAAAALLVALAGPAAYAVDTAATPHSGAIPSAGPTVAGGFGRGPRAGFGGGAPPGLDGRAQRGPDGGMPFAGPGGAGPRGGFGGLLNGSTPSAELVALLRQGGDGDDWAAATVGANSAAGIQLASDEPVMAMAIGGFNGSDPAPTLEQFQRYVAEGRIHYFIGGGGFGASQGGSDAAQQISAWVQQTFTATTVGGTTVYDLTGLRG